MSFADRQYPVNKGKYGNLKTIPRIVNKISAIFDQACERNDRTMVVRFDLHYPQDMAAPHDNTNISKAITKLKQVYARNGAAPEYLWVREQKSSDNPHYHCILLVDADVVTSREQIFQDAERLWCSTIGASRNNLLYDCTVGRDGKPHRNGIVIDKHAPDGQRNFEEAHHQGAYVGKEAGKAPAKDGLRDYGCSRISNSHGAT